MISGLKKILPDHRDYSYHRTFGTIDPGEQFNDNFNLDAGITNPSQDADGFPYGCTGYTTSELCQDEDKKQYLPRFTYDQTLKMEGQKEGVGCDIRDSLNSSIVYGVQALGEGPELALNHRRGAYFQIENSSDWFDSLRSAMVMSNRSISIGSKWYPEWMLAPFGIIPVPNWNNPNTTFHNWKICGWKTINGIVYLIGKPWIGVTWGDAGYGYFSREVINALLSQSYSGAFNLVPFDPKNVQTVVLTLWATILSYTRMWLNALKS